MYVPFTVDRHHEHAACVLSCLLHPITASMYSTMESKNVGVMYTAPSKEATMATVIAYNTNLNN